MRKNMELPYLKKGSWNLVSGRSKPKASSWAISMLNVGNKPINKDLGVKSNTNNEKHIVLASNGKVEVIYDNGTQIRNILRRVK